MASKKVVHSTVNRVSYAKCIFRVILTLSLIILLFKTVVYYSALVNTKHANTLRNKSLTFSNGSEYQLACELSEPRALDAIGRVSSDECKIKLADAACKNVLGKCVTACNSSKNGRLAVFRTLDFYHSTLHVCVYVSVCCSLYVCVCVCSCVCVRTMRCKKPEFHTGASGAGSVHVNARLPRRGRWEHTPRCHYSAV